MFGAFGHSGHCATNPIELGLAGNYGAPTRLLDFTYSPMLLSTSPCVIEGNANRQQRSEHPRSSWNSNAN
jgi:hypothetical protein